MFRFVFRLESRRKRQMSAPHQMASAAVSATYATPVSPDRGTSCAPPPPPTGARSEPVPGDTARARMVPYGIDLNSLLTSTPLHLPRMPAATVLPQPATTDPTLAAATSYYPPSQYPTPNVAYAPYPMPLQMPMYNPPQPERTLSLCRFF